MNIYIGDKYDNIFGFLSNNYYSPFFVGDKKFLSVTEFYYYKIMGIDPDRYKTSEQNEHDNYPYNSSILNKTEKESLFDVVANKKEYSNIFGGRVKYSSHTNNEYIKTILKKGIEEKFKQNKSLRKKLVSLGNYNFIYNRYPYAEVVLSDLKNYYQRVFTGKKTAEEISREDITIHNKSKILDDTDTKIITKFFTELNNSNNYQLNLHDLVVISRNLPTKKKHKTYLYEFLQVIMKKYSDCINSVWKDYKNLKDLYELLNLYISENINNLIHNKKMKKKILLDRINLISFVLCFVIRWMKYDYPSSLKISTIANADKELFSSSSDESEEEQVVQLVQQQEVKESIPIPEKLLPVAIPKQENFTVPLPQKQSNKILSRDSSVRSRLSTSDTTFRVPENDEKFNILKDEELFSKK